MDNVIFTAFSMSHDRVITYPKHTVGSVRNAQAAPSPSSRWMPCSCKTGTYLNSFNTCSLFFPREFGTCCVICGQERRRVTRFYLFVKLTQFLSKDIRDQRPKIVIFGGNLDNCGTRKSDTFNLHFFSCE